MLMYKKQTLENITSNSLYEGCVFYLNYPLENIEGSTFENCTFRCENTVFVSPYDCEFIHCNFNVLRFKSRICDVKFQGGFVEQLDFSEAFVNELEFLNITTNVQRLILSNACFGTLAMKNIGEFSSLKALDLSFSSIGDAALEFILSLNNLQRLNLTYTAITNMGLKNIAQMKTLHHLALRQTRINDTGLQYLKNLPLQYLDLQETNISNFAWEYLNHFSKLKFLNLAKTNIARLEEMKTFVELEELNLSQTKLVDSQVHYLAALPNLKKLNLNETKLSHDCLRMLIENTPKTCKIYAFGTEF